MPDRPAMRGILTAAALIGAAVLAAPAQAGLVCGHEIDFDIKLKQDLKNCPGDGLVVDDSDVTIDLNGHTIDGSGASGSYGIHAENHSGTVVKGGGGGAITGFETGVRLGGSPSSRVRGVRITGSSLDGIDVVTSNGAEVTNNRVLRSKSHGIGLVASDGVEISDNEVVGPKSSPFSVSAITVTNPLSNDNVVKGNLLRGGAAGTWGVLVNGDAEGTRVRGNSVKGFSQFGIDVYDNASNTVIRANEVLENGADGIQVDGSVLPEITSNVSRRNDGDGIEVGDFGEVGDNLAVNNGGWGIITTVVVDDTGGNRAKGNDAGQCSGIPCSPP